MLKFMFLICVTWGWCEPVLHLDAVDVSGTQQGDMSYALNGQIHKYRLDPNGERIGLGEFVTPHRGPGNSLFFMRRPRHVSSPRGTR